MTPTAQVTVAVLGGGPAGASAALELHRLGIDAVVIEQTDGGGNPIGECLAPSANPLLHQLGLAQLLPASGALPSHGNRSCWGGDGTPADRDFLRDPFGHGWHLDRAAFNRALLDTVETTGISVLRHHRITALARTSATWHIRTASPDGADSLEAAMLVDATGRRALVARQQHIRRRIVDPQAGAVGILHPGDRSTPFQDATTLIEAAENGWWYAALLPDHRLAVTWFTDPDLLARQSTWRPAAWWALLRTSALIGPLLVAHGFAPPAKIDVFPAGSSLLAQPAGNGWIATGDAAAAFDPLSSHGIGSALASGRSAARAVAAHLQGDAAAFPAYRERLLADFTHYLHERHAYYASEQRWTASPYWQRRHGGAPAGSNAGERLTPHSSLID